MLVLSLFTSTELYSNSELNTWEQAGATTELIHVELA